MCHLRSLGRVANFKNQACGNGGIGFGFFEFLTCCTCCRMIIRGGGGGGWGGVLTFLTSTSFTLRKMHTLRMLSYDHQGGWGGCINVPDEHFLYVTEDASVAHAVSCVKDCPHKRFKLAQVNHKQNIFTKTKTYHFRGRLWDKSYRTYSTNGWNMETLEKMATSVDAPQKKTQKKVHLGLQLDMASQRCLVADCGFCVATSALAPLASRRGKNWKSECCPDMIRMIENHKFLMFFFGPLKSKIEAPRRRDANFHSWVTRLPIEMNVHVANNFWRLLQIPAFCLLASKIRISNSSPLQGRRVNRLPCYCHNVFTVIYLILYIVIHVYIILYVYIYI